jgi:aspartate-semialdehyde dehydrogenase
MRDLCVAVVGATGAVGREMIRILEEGRLPVGRLVPVASERSAGRAVSFRGAEVPVLRGEDGQARPAWTDGVDLALFSAGSAVARRLAPVAAEAGALVVDNSSAFRMERSVPLVVPEVNPQAALDRPRGIIANPNCSTIQLVVVLKPLHDAAGLKRVVVSTYQAISGAGARATAELFEQARAHGDNETPVARVLPYPIFSNLLFHDVVDGDDTEEEQKVVRETRRILGEPELRITATCVRVPVAVAHSEAVNVELSRPLSAAEAREVLAAAPGIKVVDRPRDRRYPLPRDVAGTDDVHVGRIRTDASAPGALNLWVVADNLRKGAALNAVQIARLVFDGGWRGRS